MPRIAINGFDLHYQSGGDGPAVVFVHGGFASLGSALSASDSYAWTWEQEFAQQFRFIWYDRRGCYHSSCPEAGYELENQACDLELLLDHLQIACAHLVGSSAGGPISVLFAATRPNRVKSLVLVGTGLRLFPRGDYVRDIVRQQIDLFEREGLQAAFAQRPAGVEVWFESLWGREEAQARGTLTEFLEQESKLANRAAGLPTMKRLRYYAAELRNFKAYMDVDVSAYAQQVRMPTLVMHGSADSVVPLTWAEELARAIPSAQLSIIYAGNHGLMFRSIEARQKAMEFIRQAEARG